MRRIAPLSARATSKFVEIPRCKLLSKATLPAAAVPRMMSSRLSQAENHASRGSA